ncbi:MAG: dTMP kinase [Candidatus Nanopelagicales bacterium]
MSTSGSFIVFEGGEGAGKSTQEALLAEWLTARGTTVLRTREPGGTAAGEAIRTILLSNEYAGLTDRAEALLFAAARGEHAAQVIRPALESGTVVICDRYLDSSVAYQGYGRDLGAEYVRGLSLWATRDLVPDLTVLLDVDPAIGLSRVTSPDRLESEPIEYHRTVRAAFRDIANTDPTRYLVIDADQDKDVIAGQIRDRVAALLGIDS